MLNNADYVHASDLFTRLLGLIYFFAFFPFIFQVRGLFFQEGILPVKHFLDRCKLKIGKKRYYLLPTIFWINASDTALLGSFLAGILFSILLMMKIYPSLMLALLFVLQLSIVVAGQDFLSFGWEVFLLEVTFNAFFLSLTRSPNLFVWISLNLLLFRFHFQGGAVKIQSRDPNWRNLTACSYHYQTQPLPNTTAWFAHKLPMWLHKLSTAFTFFAELAAPFFIFSTELVRLVVFAVLFTLQFMIWLTGNLSYLNHLTVVCCLLLLSDVYLSPILGGPHPAPGAPWQLEVFLSLIGLCLISCQLMNLWNHFFPPIKAFKKILHFLSPYHIVNRYGIFAIMTTKRYEIVIEGSADGTNWKEYLFYYKPSELSRRPRRISPFQPRLDWQAWFLPFSRYEAEPWFQRFLIKLLDGSSVHVSKLLRHNPFPDHPPKYIRAVVYDYVFTTTQEKNETGRWWKRNFIGRYSPTLMRTPEN